MSNRYNIKSTRISLNERFNILRQNPVKNQQTNQVKTVSQGSTRNKRLAMQMANRTSVQAALRIKNKSIKQRLGVKNRFGNPRLGNKRNQMGNVNNVKLIGGGLKTNKFRLNRGNFVGVNRVRNAIPKKIQVNEGRFIAKRRPQLQRRLRQNQQQQQPSTSFTNQPQRFRRGRLNIRNKITLANKKQMITGQKFVGKFNKNRNFNANNRGNIVIGQQRQRKGQRQNQRQFARLKFSKKSLAFSGNNRWQKRGNLNKDHLDKDLDAYMAKTKTQLDCDLDAYMSTTN